MTEETTNPEMEVETPTVETQEVETEQEPIEAVGDDQAEDEYEELEFEGEKLAIPKNSKIKEALMKNADYTRKTSEVAEMRRATEAQALEIQKEREALQAHFQSRAELFAIDQRLKQYEQVNFQELYQSDPDTANRLHWERQNLLEIKNAKKSELDNAEKEITLKEQQETAKRQQEGAAVLSREISGWNVEKAKATADYIKSQTSLGITEEAIRDLDSGKYGAAPIVWAHKAYLYDQLLKRQATKPAAPQAPLKVVKGGKSPPTEFSPNMTDAQYDAWRARRKKQT